MLVYLNPSSKLRQWAFVRCFFFSSRRRHTRCSRDWSSDVCSSDLITTITRVSRSVSLCLPLRTQCCRLWALLDSSWPPNTAPPAESNHRGGAHCCETQTSYATRAGMVGTWIG